MASTKAKSGKDIWVYAEEAAERLMRGVEATTNEYRRSKAQEPSSEVANASDLAGG